MSVFISLSLWFHVAISPGVIAQSLNSTLHGGQRACFGSAVTFTCETRGSDAIAWTSDAYIGPQQLGFVATRSNRGDTLSSVSHPSTLATLTGVYMDQGVMVLVSTLQITTITDPQNASVTCIHALSGNTNTTNFQVIGKSFLKLDVLCQDTM